MKLLSVATDLCVEPTYVGRKIKSEPCFRFRQGSRSLTCVSQTSNDPQVCRALKYIGFYFYYIVMLACVFDDFSYINSLLFFYLFIYFILFFHTFSLLLCWCVCSMIYIKNLFTFIYLFDFISLYQSILRNINY